MANSEDEFEPSTKRFKADKSLVGLSAVTSHEMTLTTKPLTGRNYRNNPYSLLLVLNMY